MVNFSNSIYYYLFINSSIERGDRLQNVNIEKIFNDFPTIPDKVSFKYAFVYIIIIIK